MASELRLERTIQALPTQVFRMFTNAIALREWLCDQAIADPRPGGYLSVVWNNGYFASGQYTLLQAPGEVNFTWRGKNDPDLSQVRVLFDGEAGATRVTMLHSGLGESDAWAAVRETTQQGWERSLENLAHVLEHGPDLRIVNRPMMGVVFGEFSPEVAERLNVPIRSGVRLDGVIDHLGAQRAGLQKDDVLCEIAGKSITNGNDLAEVFQGRSAGERLEVTYYRGPEKHNAQIELSRRPLPEIPMDAAGLADAIEKRYQDDYAELQRELVGVSEEEASRCPTAAEWCVKDVIAHLVIAERTAQHLIAGQVLSQATLADDSSENVNAQVRAITLVYGTVEALMELLKRSQAETVELLRNLPQDFVSRKSSLWQAGYALLAFPRHAADHNQQIRAAIEAARK